eukprot:TRINITY_DN2379_c0_g1_i5.p1 TRINITY_DN2379_c0_g1~~TRINITY_DN2379_c0_g1_i5.p1  ORF type:complete len:355 (-),score=37.15 TRINITY_DN2379_c0_g1_i5:50-1114(-)
MAMTIDEMQELDPAYIPSLVACLIYCVLGLILLSFWIVSVRLSYVLQRKHTYTRHRILGCTTLFALCWGPSWILPRHLRNLGPSYILSGVLTFAGLNLFSFAFMYTAFLYVMFCWLRILALNFPPNHIIFKLSRKRNLCIIIFNVWLGICAVVGVVMFSQTRSPDVYTWAIVAASLCPILMTIGLVGLAPAILRIIKKLLNVQRGRHFSRRITLLAVMFLIVLDLTIITSFLNFYQNYVTDDIIYAQTRNWFLVHLPNAVLLISIMYSFSPFDDERMLARTSTSSLSLPSPPINLSPPLSPSSTTATASSSVVSSSPSPLVHTNIHVIDLDSTGASEESHYVGASEESNNIAPP